jgi:Ca2+-binding EF-hand superfamily protein
MIVVAFVSIANFSFGQDRPQGERKTPPTYAQLLTDMDANKDGKLAQTEVKGPLKDRFVKIDTNEDGLITEEEFKNAPRPQKGRRPPRND